MKSNAYNHRAMNTKNYFRNNYLKSLIGIASSFVLLLPSGRAESVTNAYVTCIGAGISLCDDGLNFHVPQSEVPVQVTVQANPPYRLVSPAAPGIVTIPPHGSKNWEVESEDGELGITRRAKGTISRCECAFFI